MKRNALLVLLLATAVAGAYVVGGHAPPPRAAAAADVQPGGSGVVVDGTGHVSGTPDVLRVVLGVSVRRSDLTMALADANARQARLTSVLEHEGVAAKDLQTSDVNVGSAYDNHGRPDGYQVSETLTAKLRDLKKAGRVLSDALDAAGSEAVLQGVSFALEDNAALLQQARDDAFADAKAKAERYAMLSGRALGAVELVTESTSASQPQVYDGMQALAAAVPASAPVPLQPGTSDVSVSVTVRWALR